MPHDPSELTCPLPDVGSGECVALAHGEGGRLMRALIAERIQPRLANRHLTNGDAAVLPAAGESLAMTTDSFVVSPLFFPGGDIGTLAVYGTVNDLAVSGATPRWLTLALVIEEGLSLAVLDTVLDGVAAASARAGVAVVAGDTKVVPRGAADKLFINTAGVGSFEAPPPPGPSALAPGDELLVTGPIGRHGMAVLGAREDFGFADQIQSDCAPLTAAVARLQREGIPLCALRDATRGGVAAVLHEWADACRCTLSIDEAAVPVDGAVRGACELLGLDPLHIACEGTMVIAVKPGASGAALAALGEVRETAQAAVIGKVQPRTIAPVVVRGLLGRERPLDEPLSAPLPRIC